MSDKPQDKKKGPDDYSFGTPGPLAISINQAGFDVMAGIFLYRIKWRSMMKQKLIRFGMEWVAMSRKQWAQEAGLTPDLYSRVITGTNARNRKLVILTHKSSLWVSASSATLELGRTDWSQRRRCYWLICS
ncbi:MAG: hypothetical protein AAGD13_05260 [Pseudomonadota bacterium]